MPIGRDFQRQESVKFPYATGTSILDRSGTRIPVIGVNECAYVLTIYGQSEALARWMDVYNAQ